MAIARLPLRPASVETGSQCAGPRIDGKDGNGAVQKIRHVGERARSVDGDGKGPGPRRHGAPRLVSAPVVALMV